MYVEHFNISAYECLIFRFVKFLSLCPTLTCLSLCRVWRHWSWCDRSLGTDEMHSSVDGQPSPLGREGTGSNNNNNNSSENSGNSGSQYALCALGVGLVALGMVMIVWSVVPADTSANGSSSSGGDTGGRKNKASSVAFVLVGAGVAMLLLSLCLGMRNKQREQLRLQEAQNRRGAASSAQEEREM